MPEQNIPPLRTVKTLTERAAELERQEKALAVQIQALQKELEEVTIQRCAIAYEQRRGIGSSLQKRPAAAFDWPTLLRKEDAERSGVKKARTKALSELHLVRGWVSWAKYPQVLVAFQLSKTSPGEMFWVRDGLLELMPHLPPLIPGYKGVGICIEGPFNIRHFLLCAESGDHFIVVQPYLKGGDQVMFESLNLHSVLEYVQKNLAK